MRLALDPDSHLDISLSTVQRGIKRAFDIVVALFALIALIPVLMLIVVAVKASSPGPILYRGSRVGMDGEHFRILKFRSMVRNAEEVLRTDAHLYGRYLASGYKLPEEMDPRLTAVGRFLRKTSLDELPQFCNVLVGHMSIVGARPVVPDELSEYGDLVSVYLAARPGLTGNWQVAGRSEVRFPERAYLDIENLHEWSLFGDFKIMVKTIPAVLSRRGAH